MRKLKFSKNIIIFLALLVITSFLWLLRALNDEYTAVFRVSVSYRDLPQNLGLSSETPQTFSLKLSGSARRLKETKHVFENILMLSGKKIARKGESHYFPPEYIRNAVTKLLAQDVRIIQINPDTLYLNLQTVAYKKVPVRANLNVEYAPMFDCFSGPVLRPDSIVVSGSRKDVDKTEFVVAQSLNLKNVSDTVYRSVSLVRQEGIKYSLNRVGLILPVEKYTEKQIDIEPEIRQLPDTVYFVSFPKRARISFIVGLSMYDSVTASDFVLAEDFETLHNEQAAFYTPELEQYPDYIKNINVSPQSFEYIIERKKTETLKPYE